MDKHPRPDQAPEPIDPVAILEAADSSEGSVTKRLLVTAAAGIPLVTGAANVISPDVAGAVPAEQAVDASAQAEGHLSHEAAPVSSSTPAEQSKRERFFGWVESYQRQHPEKTDEQIAQDFVDYVSPYSRYLRAADAHHDRNPQLTRAEVAQDLGEFFERHTTIPGPEQPAANLSTPPVSSPRSERSLSASPSPEDIERWNQAVERNQQEAARQREETAAQYDDKDWVNIIPSGPGTPYSSEAEVQEFMDAVSEMSERLGADPDDMLGAMNFETGGSFDPAERNDDSDATGLIQFMPDTAEGLGTSIDELAAMSPVEQLEYVEMYFQDSAGQLNRLEDLYLKIFYPAAMGTPLDHVVARAGSSEYEQNNGFDQEGKGYFTTGDITGLIRQRYDELPDLPPAPEPAPTPAETPPTTETPAQENETAERPNQADEQEQPAEEPQDNQAERSEDSEQSVVNEILGGGASEEQAVEEEAPAEEAETAPEENHTSEEEQGDREEAPAADEDAQQSETDESEEAEQPEARDEAEGQGVVERVLGGVATENAGAGDEAQAEEAEQPEEEPEPAAEEPSQEDLERFYAAIEEQNAQRWYEAASTPRREQFATNFEYLQAATRPTVEGYRNFQIDQSRMGAFDAELSGETIDNQMHIMHWTGSLYNDVDHFIEAISGREGGCCNVQYYIDRNGHAYQFMPGNQMAAQAADVNSISKGTEIEARGLEDYTPEQMEAMVYIYLRDAREFGMPINHDTLEGHSEHSSNGKTDPPPEVADWVNQVALELNHQLVQEGL